MDLHAEAKRRFAEHLEQNPYPGRGLVVGRATSGEWLQVYWIMGRSENSRNRRFVAEPGGVLRTRAVDPAKLADPTLVIYEAMLELPGLYAVSNGDQTRSVRDALAAGGDFAAALATREREPDAPNYTPRISALLDLRGAPALALSILRRPTAPPSARRRRRRASGSASPPTAATETPCRASGATRSGCRSKAARRRCSNVTGRAWTPPTAWPSR
jgi:hypothetical protein